MMCVIILEMLTTTKKKDDINMTVENCETSVMRVNYMFLLTFDMLDIPH